MTEDQIKKIVQNSTLKTSENFVGDLMNHIEAKVKVERTKVWSLGVTVSGILFILLILNLIFYKVLNQSITVLNIDLSGYKNALMLLFLIIIFTTINFILRLHEQYRYSQNKI